MKLGKVTQASPLMVQLNGDTAAAPAFGPVLAVNTEVVVETVSGRRFVVYPDGAAGGDHADSDHADAFSALGHGHDYLPVGGKAADSNLLDGIDSTAFTRAREAAGGDPSCPTIATARTFLMTGIYNLTGTNTDSPWGDADTRWWFLQVMAHTNNNQWQRQIAWDMTGGTDVWYTRRLSDAGGGAIGYSAWVAK